MKKNTFYSILYILTLVVITINVYSCDNEYTNKIDNLLEDTGNISSETSEQNLKENTRLIADETYYKYDDVIERHVYYTTNYTISRLLLDVVQRESIDYTYDILDKTVIITSEKYLNYLFQDSE